LPGRGACASITYDGCLGDTAELGCVDLPEAPLDGAEGWR
jgi:hypothetical protein